MKKFKDSKGGLFVDPIESKYNDLIELTDEQFDAELAIKNTSPPLTAEEKVLAIRDAIGQQIESVAKSAGDFGFDSVLSAVSYIDGAVDDVNTIYGKAIFDYRAACWAKARELLGAWQAGGAELTPEDAVAQMPLWSDYEPEI
jgi:hypothetical protein